VRLMADMSIQSGIDRLVAWHPHSGQLHGFYDTTTIHLLEPTSPYVKLCARFRWRDEVITVAPDAGASKPVTLFSRLLEVSSAVASKLRTSPSYFGLQLFIPLLWFIFIDWNGQPVGERIKDLQRGGARNFPIVHTVINV